MLSRSTPSKKRIAIAGANRITGTAGWTREHASSHLDSNIGGEAFRTSVRFMPSCCALKAGPLADAAASSGGASFWVYFGKPNRRAGRARSPCSSPERALALVDREAPLVERLADDHAAEVHLPQRRETAQVVERSDPARVQEAAAHDARDPADLLEVGASSVPSRSTFV